MGRMGGKKESPAAGTLAVGSQVQSVLEQAALQGSKNLISEKAGLGTGSVGPANFIISFFTN